MTDPHIQMGRKLAAARDALGPTYDVQDLSRFDRTGMVDHSWSDFDPHFKPLPLFCVLVAAAVIGLALCLAISTYIMGAN
jgi:hypothetical protein